ncbi:MAG: methyltransferase domain-containing protein [Thermoplasmata archaeon]
MPVTGRDSFKPIPPAYWDDAATTWGRQVYDKAGAHQFQYYEADLLISSVLRRGMRVLEIGCGAGDSTLVHAPEARLVVATDVSREMVVRARNRLKHKTFRSRLRFALADAGHLPFRDASFDAVIGRGVALSYVKSPEQTLREIYRVLRADGRVAIDAMNVNAPLSRSNTGRVRFRTVRRLRGKPVYIEQFNEGGLQVRQVYYLRPRSRLAVYARESKIFKTRPKGLRRQVLRIERMHARYFSGAALRRLATRAGFSGIEVVPLGQLYRILRNADAATRKFVVRNRRILSRIVIELRDHFKIGSGFHVMLVGARGRT